MSECWVVNCYQQRKPESHLCLLHAPEPVVVVEEVAAPSRGPRLWWTRERVIGAIRIWALEHGRPPTQKDWALAGDLYPCKTSAAKACGSWNGAIVAAGFEANRRGAKRATHDDLEEVACQG